MSDSSKALSFADILAANDLDKRERVECPEWGGHVYVRTLTAKERDSWEASLVDPDTKRGVKIFVGRDGLRARWAALVICDATGAAIVNTPSQIEQLAAKSSVPLDRIWDAGRRLNGMVSGDDAGN